MKISTLAPRLVSLFWLCAAPASAAVLISNLSNPTGGFQTAPGPLGQAFTVATGFDATITGATIRINPFTETNLLGSTLNLVDFNSGTILGNFTRTTLYAGDGVYANYSYSLSTPVVLTQNTIAAIQLTTSVGGIRWSDPATITNTSNGLTHNFQFFGLAPAASGSQRPNRMLSYEIEGTLAPAAPPPPGVPEPSTYVLMGTSVAALWVIRHRKSASAAAKTL